MDFFTKPLAQISADDIQWLVHNEIREASNLEFKALPTEEGEKPWMRSDGSITDEGKKKILKEIVAFANASGGTLVFGIAEKNACAHKMTLIPNAEACVERFKNICRSLVEPAIPGLELCAIPTDGNAGVLVFRIPGQSSMGTSSKQC